MLTFKNPTLGKIELRDSWGNDQKVVDCARVSFHKGIGEQKTETSRFIENLISMKHETPFEHCGVTFYVECPIFVWRQWIRHRLASVNELSGRYSEMECQFYQPNLWRAKGSHIIPNEVQNRLSREQYALHEYLTRLYNERLELGISREMARIDLPLSMLTAAYWTVNLREFFHFLRLRCVKQAQMEIQLFATAACELVQEKFPESINAFLKNESGVLARYIENNEQLVLR